MPKLRHFLLAKHYEDRNPKYHEEHQKGVAELLAARPPKKVVREHK
jgi:hypothetical protein